LLNIPANSVSAFNISGFWSDAAHEPKYGPKSYPGCSLRIDFTRRALYG